jgi:hypothetical protein
MKRARRQWMILVLGSATFVAAQDLQGQPTPAFPSDFAVGSQLIVWSHLQKPQPIPQALPQADRGRQTQPAFDVTSPRDLKPSGRADVRKVTRDGREVISQSAE